MIEVYFVQYSSTLHVVVIDCLTSEVLPQRAYRTVRTVRALVVTRQEGTDARSKTDRHFYVKP